MSHSSLQSSQSPSKHTFISSLKHTQPETQTKCSYLKPLLNRSFPRVRPSIHPSVCLLDLTHYCTTGGWTHTHTQLSHLSGWHLSHPSGWQRSHPSGWQLVASRLKKAEARGINSLCYILCVCLCQTAADPLIHSDNRGTVETDITRSVMMTHRCCLLKPSIALYIMTFMHECVIHSSYRVQSREMIPSVLQQN